MRVYGAAPRAFIVVPRVCGFFIDLVNAWVVGVLARAADARRAGAPRHSDVEHPNDIRVGVVGIR